jgi:hypothetical protein
MRLGWKCPLRDDHRHPGKGPPFRSVLGPQKVVIDVGEVIEVGVVMDRPCLARVSGVANAARARNVPCLRLVSALLDRLGSNQSLNC